MTILIIAIVFFLLKFFKIYAMGRQIITVDIEASIEITIVFKNTNLKTLSDIRYLY
jgi:hypothetical protein